ncbi:hypothetical protein [Dactylosporangium sp. NPDC051541]|uniref:hypothetical protein n=1 Tax=Dactylosporangium sp. NPDC051541 TaxID=3363977 RepID=UPI0037A940BE
MTEWHLEPATIGQYTRNALALEQTASVEAHLLRCGQCRAVLAPHVDAGRAAAIWAEVADRIDAPRPAWPERLLIRLGVRAETARLVAATPTLRGPWLLAIAAVLAFAVWAAQLDQRLLPLFPVAAPLGPLAGVAVAFAGGLDPTREIGLAAPYSGLRLLLIRTATVLAVTVPIVAVAGLALPGPHWAAAAWLLPTAGLTGAALALTGRLTPLAAAAVVAAAWLLVTVPITAAGRLDLAFGAAAQVFWLALAAAALFKLRSIA